MFYDHNVLRLALPFQQTTKGVLSEKYYTLQ